MSNIDPDLIAPDLIAFDNHQSPHFVIVAARFNAPVVDALVEGAMAVLERYGISQERIQLLYVPGAFELPFAADQVMQQLPSPAAIIALGAVIRGETPHFDFVARACSQGLMEVGLRYHRAVAFGVLTTDTLEQAYVRAGGKHGNKGEEAALAALRMVALSQQLEQQH